MSDPSEIREPHLRRGDFLGAFAILQQNERLLMVQNERRIGGVLVHTWDLPGGQVEPGEMLEEALRRELREETGLEASAEPDGLGFAFIQEGEKRLRGRRLYAWRSFFFAVRQWRGEARPGGEVRALRWVPLPELPELLTAPYHRSFLTWLRQGGAWQRAAWDD